MFMLVIDIADTQAPVCTESMSLEKVFEQLSDSPIDLAIVVESHAHPIPIGIITIRDICSQLVSRRRDPRVLSAANVMTSHYAKVIFDTDLQDLIFIAESSDGALVVVDQDGRYCGTVDRDRLKRSALQQEDLLPHAPPSMAGYRTIDRIF